MNRLIRSLIAPFTRIEIDPDSGILLQEGAASPSHVVAVRLWNLVEPFAVFGAIMLVVWGSMLDPALWWVKPSLGLLALWALVLSPIVHYPFEKDLFLTPEQKARGFGFYFFECRGLSSPLRYYLPMNGKRPLVIEYLKEVITVTAAIDVLLLCACITFKEDIRERYAAYMGDSALQAVGFQAALMLGIDAILVFLLFPFMLRLDNLRRSLPFILGFMALIAALTLVGNLLFHMNEDALRIRYADNPYMRLRGDPAMERLRNLDIFAIGGQWSGYVFWGFLQELLFLGVFGTQFSRAFNVGKSKLHVFLACLCTAILFGLVHVPNFWLGIVTFSGGLFGGLFFMQCRNLFAMGFVHGFGGTITNKLLPINFSVGPSEVVR